jgi:hypothetical protein
MNKMMKVMLMVAMLALSGTAFAEPNGEPNNTNCNGVGNKNSPCVSGGGGGNEGGGGGGGSAALQVTVEAGAVQVNPTASATGGSVTNSGNVDVRNTNLNSNLQTQSNNLNVAAGAIQNTVQGSSLTVAEGAITNNNTANGGEGGAGGNATASATGGAGGQAVSAAVVEAGAASAVVESGAVQYTYKEVQQAPSIGQGSFAITGCSIAGNAGGSGPGWSGFLGFGFTPSQCYDFMLAQAYQSIGEKKAVCDILKNSKAGKRQEKRGVVLPECVPVPPEVKTVVVESPPKTVYVEVPPAKISE